MVAAIFEKTKRLLNRHYTPLLCLTFRNTALSIINTSGHKSSNKSNIPQKKKKAFEIQGFG